MPTRDCIGGEGWERDEPGGGEGRTIWIWQQLLYFDSQQLATVIVCWVWRNKQCESLALIDTVRSEIKRYFSRCACTHYRQLAQLLTCSHRGRGKGSKDTPFPPKHVLVPTYALREWAHLSIQNCRRQRP